jgi:hypothetical protein
VTFAADSWERLLKSATVDIRGRLKGTGFVVAPDLVVTCAHVVAKSTDPLPERLDGQVVALNLRLTLEPIPESYVWDRDNGLDLVVLRVVGEGVGRVKPVLMSDALAIGDALWAYGHPADSPFSAGQSATSRYEGPSLRSTRPGAPELPRGWGTPVREGFSGSGVINRRTGAVCGMLCTSDHGGSAHMIPVAEILRRCPQAAGNENLRGDWLSALTDDQVAAGGWGFPGPLLRKYVVLAAKAAETQPYPLLKKVRTAIPLSSVFVRRQASALARDADLAQGGTPSDTSVPDQVRVPAEELFGLDEDVVLVGAPGSGKSSLLRAAVRELAGGWEQQDRPALVPVRVHALDLDRKGEKGLPEALAAGLRVELAGQWHAGEPWPVSWFARPPAPGARWLIMVDGLDEINDPERRREVLRRIRTMRADDPHHRVSVCLVATRPLPDGELPPEQGRRFELMPFEPRDLVGFAEKWLKALDVDDWRFSAERFTAELRAAGMTDPARNPLMASMLCQLYSLDRDAALPPGRAAAYRAFVRHVQARVPARPGTGLKEQIDAMLKQRPDSPDAEKAVQHLPSQLPEFLRKLALARHDGDRSTAVDLVTRWACSEDLRPSRTPVQEWEALMRELTPELLRTSGLLVENDSDFVFVHQTFEEYLTVQAIAADTPRSKAEFQRVFGIPLLAVDWGGARIGVLTPGADSLTRFLVEEWNARHQPQLSKVLRRIAPTTDGAKFIATIVADGARLDEAVRVSAAEALVRVASQGDLDASAALSHMGDRRGGDILTEQAMSAVEPHQQIAAAQTLADLGDPRGMTALHTLAIAEPALALEAAEELARRGDERGAELVRQAIRDPRTDTDSLLKATAAAARLGAPSVPEELVARAFDRQFPYDQRITVAQYLDKLSDPRGAEVLSDMVREPPHGAAVHAALQALGGGSWLYARTSDHARDALRALATDQELPMSARVKAAWRLQEAWSETDLLLNVAEDARVPPKERLDIIVGLRHDPRTVAVAGALARDRRAGPQVRLEAAQFLARSDDRQAVASLLNEAGLPPEMRVALLTTSEHYDVGQDSWWQDAVVAAIRDGSVPDGRRRELIDRLVYVEGRSGRRRSNHLSSLAAAHGLPGSLRLHAVRVGRKRSDPGIYSELFLDPSLEPRFRITALALAFAELSALLAVAVATGVGRLVSELVRIVRVLIIAGLPLCAAVAAVALGEAHRSDSPPPDWKQGAYTALTMTLLGTVFRAAARRGRPLPSEVGRRGMLGAVALAVGACIYGLSHPEALHGWAPAVCAGAAALAPASVSMSPRSTGRERTVRRRFGGHRKDYRTPRGWSNPVNPARLALAVLTTCLAWFAVTRPESLGGLADLGTWLAAELPWTGQMTVSW